MKVPVFELQQRVNNLQETLRRKAIDGALLVQRADTLYYSGTAQNIHIYIPQIGQPLVMAYRDIGRAEDETAWNIVPLLGLSKIPGYIKDAGFPLPKVLGLEFDVLPVNHYERYRKAFQEIQFVDVSPYIRLQRATKSDWEITRLEETALVYPQVLAYAQEILRPGITEVEFDSHLEQKARASGHEGYTRVRGFGSEFHFGAIVSGLRATVPGSFDGPIVGTGASIACPLGPSKAVIQAGDSLILDFVTAVNGYHTDQTRVMAYGNMSPDLLAAHEIALEVEERLRKALIPGRIAGDIYDEIVTWVSENTPYDQNFMGIGHTRVGFIGHGIGLELDELPIISRGAKDVLVSGMVVAIEPKFVFPGLGAVGIEDTVVVEGEAGARFLTLSPREVIIVR